MLPPVSYPPNPYSVPTKPIPVSCVDSEIQSIVSGEVNFDRSSAARSRVKTDPEIEKSLQANKNMTHQPLPNLPNCSFKPDESIRKELIKAPLAEKNPREFFKQVNEKLELFMQE
jgi:hypothetical protein